LQKKPSLLLFRSFQMEERKITPVHYEVLIKVFQLDGFMVSRKKGDHIIMTKIGVKRPLVIKTSPRLIPVTHIRTNMTTAGMTRERFFKLLAEVK
jgi:predicted RNA binding protein YcfA (HicA-like mRNA interferase family)